MPIVHGKHVRAMDAAEVASWTAGHRETTVDPGAGDGRFVRHLAKERAGSGAIGVDLCAANLGVASAAAAGNALFVVADALALPAELGGVATRVTINFPWGEPAPGIARRPPGPAGGARRGREGRGQPRDRAERRRPHRGRLDAAGRRRAGDGGAAGCRHRESMRPDSWTRRNSAAGRRRGRSDWRLGETRGPFGSRRGLPAETPPPRIIDRGGDARHPRQGVLARPRRGRCAGPAVAALGSMGRPRIPTRAAE